MVKKILLVLLVLKISISPLYSQSGIVPRAMGLSHSFSVSFREKTNVFTSFTIGPELFLWTGLSDNEIISKMFPYNRVGFYYRHSFRENKNFLLLNYSVLYPIFQMVSPEIPIMCILGAYGQYNINNNIFGVIPEVGISLLGFISLTYGYNIIGNESNTHEVMLKFLFPYKWFDPFD